MRHKIKTVDITAKEWFDKTYGNSYFSCHICLNYRMPGETHLYMPFQYGYGDHYRDMAKKELVKQGFIKTANEWDSLWSWCQQNNVIDRYVKYMGCRKREVINFGKP